MVEPRFSVIVSGKNRWTIFQEKSDFANESWIIGEGGENGKQEKDVSQPTVSNGEQPINGNEAGDKAKKEAESKKSNGELIVDKNTQEILESLSNGNGNKKPKK